jgi:hypothetical protein
MTLSQESSGDSIFWATVQKETGRRGGDGRRRWTEGPFWERPRQGRRHEFGNKPDRLPYRDGSMLDPMTIPIVSLSLAGRRQNDLVLLLFSTL